MPPPTARTAAAREIYRVAVDAKGALDTTATAQLRG
jgi:hypothetical protein